MVAVRQSRQLGGRTDRDDDPRTPRDCTCGSSGECSVHPGRGRCTTSAAPSLVNAGDCSLPAAGRRLVARGCEPVSSRRIAAALFMVLAGAAAPAIVSAGQQTAPYQDLRVYYCNNLAILTVRVFADRVEVTTPLRSAALPR